MRRSNLTTSVIADGTAAWLAWRALHRPQRVPIRAYLAWIAIVSLAFLLPLFRLAVLASEIPMHSHVLLVLFIAAYLLYQQRETLPAPGRRRRSCSVP